MRAYATPTGKSVSVSFRVLVVRARVRACVRAKLRGRGDSSVASVWQANLWGGAGLLSLTFKVNLASCKSVYQASHEGANQLFW